MIDERVGQAIDHDGRRNDHGPAKQFLSRAQIQSVQSMNIAAVLHRHRQEENGMESRINDRRALNSELGVVNTAALVGLRNGGGAIREQAHIPKRRCITALIVVGVEGVNAIVHRDRIHGVVRRIRCRDEDVGNIERLGGHLSIQALREKLTKLDRIDVGRSQDRFPCVLTGASVVVVLGQDADLADGGRVPRQKKKDGCRSAEERLGAGG